MTKGKQSHLSGESLLLLISGELPDTDRQSAVDHLASCDRCRQRLEETGTVVDELRQAVEQADYQRFSSRLDSTHRRSGLFSRLLRYGVTAGSIAAALTVGMLVWNSSVRPVSATELLDRAVDEESQQIKRAGYVRIRDASGECAIRTGNVPLVPAGASCGRIRSRLQSAHWDLRNPLSARAFQHWRSTLSDKHDTVTQETGSFKLRTSTSRGLLRAAVLQVRTGDFHPMSVRMEFEEPALIEISEESAPEPITSVVPQPSFSPKPVTVTPDIPAVKQPAQELAERLDSAEIRVRVVLHERQADLGYETTLRRGPETVQVFGLVRDFERQAALTASLAAIPDVQVSIKTYAQFEPGDDSAFPRGEQGNTLPPIAAKWLKSTWPNQEQSAAFVNQAVQLSSALLGEATVLQELTLRCSALSGNPAVGDLLLVRQDHEKQIATLLSSLRTSLEPLTGPLAEPSSITFEDARTLQSAIVRLFSASRPEAGSIEDEIGRLRSVFTTAK